MFKCCCSTGTINVSEQSSLLASTESPRANGSNNRNRGINGKYIKNHILQNNFLYKLVIISEFGDYEDGKINSTPIDENFFQSILNEKSSFGRTDNFNQYMSSQGWLQKNLF